MAKIYGLDLTDINIYLDLDEQEKKVMEADDLILTDYDQGDGESRYTLSNIGDEMLTAEEVHEYLHAWYNEAPEIYDAIEE